MSEVRPHEEFIKRAKKGLPSDRLITGAAAYLELARDLIQLKQEMAFLQRVNETCADVIEEQHKIITEMNDDIKSRGVDSMRLFREDAKKRG